MVVNDGGWELDTEKAEELLDEMTETYGAQYMLDSLVKAMGTDELARNMVYIARQHDFRSSLLQ